MPRSRKNLPISGQHPLFFFPSSFFLFFSPLLLPLLFFFFFFSLPLDTVNAQNLCTDVNLLPPSLATSSRSKWNLRKGMADPLSSSTLVRVYRVFSLHSRHARRDAHDGTLWSLTETTFVISRSKIFPIFRTKHLEFSNISQLSIFRILLFVLLFIYPFGNRNLNNKKKFNHLRNETIALHALRTYQLTYTQIATVRRTFARWMFRARNRSVSTIISICRGPKIVSGNSRHDRALVFYDIPLSVSSRMPLKIRFYL